MSDLATQLAATAREWLRLEVPYVHRGTRRTGCDCTGLLLGCLRELGFLQRYRLRWYPKDWNVHSMGRADDFLQKEMARVATRVQRPPRTGDIVLFRFGQCVAHCGIVLNEHSFAHSHANARKVSLGLFRTPKWATRIASVWEIDQVKMAAVNG